MATMIEKKAESIKKEIAKYEARLERNKAKLAKATKKAEAMDATEFKEEWNTTNPDNPMFRLPEYLPFVSAYFDYYGAKREVEETERYLNNAKARLEKILPKVDEVQAATDEAEYIAEVERKVIKAQTMTPEEFAEWLAEFKAECLKDGIIIKEYYGILIYGTAKNGKDFNLTINNGYTERSLHCYSLTMDGETIFTSGTFETAYRYLKR